MEQLIIREIHEQAEEWELKTLSQRPRAKESFLAGAEWLFERLSKIVEEVQQEDSADAGKCVCWYEKCACPDRDSEGNCNC